MMEQQERLSFDKVADLYDYLHWYPGRQPSILAHRGAPGPGFPENAIATYDQALEVAPCWIEVDIRRSRDGVFVLSHDLKLDRCTTGTGRLDERTLEELQQLHLRDQTGTATPYHMPTLDDVIEWARGRTLLFLDIKAGQPDYKDVLRFVRKREAHTFSVILTYAIEDSLAIHHIDPDLVVYGRATDEATFRELLECGIPHRQLVSWVSDDTPRSIYRRLHEQGILTTYGAFLGVDRRAASEGLEVYRPWLDNGADIINTDDVPQTARAIARFWRK